MYEDSTDDFYQDMWTMSEEFDLASYPKSIPFYHISKNKIVRNIKHEPTRPPIIEFVGLKPKMYS